MKDLPSVRAVLFSDHVLLFRLKAVHQLLVSRLQPGCTFPDRIGFS